MAAAEGVEENASDAGEEKSGGKSKLLLIGLPVVLLVGGGAGVYFAGLIPGTGEEIVAEVDGGEPDPEFAVTAVVSATAAGSSLHRAWDQLEGLAPDSCAVTRMDESDEPGIVCSWLEEVGLPLRWIGTGQRIPDDLARATGANLALWLVAA